MFLDPQIFSRLGYTQISYIHWYEVEVLLVSWSKASTPDPTRAGYAYGSLTGRFNCHSRLYRFRVICAGNMPVQELFVK